MKKENSTNSINNNALLKFCNAHKTISQISGRWKVSIILALKNNNITYSDFKSQLPNITDRILTKQLKELQDDAIITNKKDKTQSIYLLTPKGEKVKDILDYINSIELK